MSDDRPLTLPQSGVPYLAGSIPMWDRPARPRPHLAYSRRHYDPSVVIAAAVIGAGVGAIFGAALMGAAVLL